ncbi:MAG: bacillithiol biosynthesis cysteine-adding enzyme BshC [Bacteroidetes bacterium]|nr:bacillithiol biosynthesis cysteine-adding enzyme BshC [Bacteroidota bacterium]
MDCNAIRIPYRQTGFFTRTALDYIDQADALKSFFVHPPSLQGIQKAIEARKRHKVDRETLVRHLKSQYQSVSSAKAVHENIEALLSADTFTVTTAHQPNIFTGPLYFIYKILHAIRLSEHLKKLMPEYRFIPVYYMGSEDADLDELGHIHLDGQKIEWNTKQTGAVGRMKIDKEFIQIISRIVGCLSVLPFGEEILSLVKKAYRENVSVQDATFYFVNELFAEYGLIVLVADDASLKKPMTGVFEDDLMNQKPSRIVEGTAKELQAAGYKVQAHPREINLFYLKDNLRERIVEKNSQFAIHNSQLQFSKEQMLEELEKHPERFSPNVILRGLFQETILPNLVFIGGGGELAYWLQLKDLFQQYSVPFPVLLLRNSFLVVEKKWQDKIQKLGFTSEDIFSKEEELLNRLVKREIINDVGLNGTYTETGQIYDSVKKQATAIDKTLSAHVDALKTQALHRLHELEKKIFRSAKRKFTDQQRMIESVKGKLFPLDSLQERQDNFLSYYAKWGKDFLKELYKNSLTTEQEFVVLSEK